MTEKTNYGATPEDWANLQFCLGLGEDLLPTVSNPHAKISANSKMKALGKTPSQYNAKREVAGIAKWTDRVAEPRELERWSAEPDYGVCIQTRQVRALDIDITDQEEADAVWRTITEVFGGLAPTRRRPNSSKCLVAFVLEGDLPKRVFKTHHGIVEFLATGQQFVAHGTHPSGARYEWDHLDSFPTITLEEFNFLWDKLEMLYATEVSKTGNGPRRNDTALAVHDPLMDRLAAAGLILGYGNDGQAFIECPWKHEHSSDSGETEFAYFPKGSRGYTEGNFRCMHASHMDKSNFDFEQALLGIADDFEDLPAGIEEPGVLKTIPVDRLSGDKKGKDASLNNLIAVLDAPGSGGVHIVYDRFLDEDMWMPVSGEHGWRIVDDKVITALRVKLEAMGFKDISQERMKHAVEMAGQRNQVDSAQKWLETKVWDGVPRIDTFLTVYCGAEDHPYARATSAYMWTALAARVMVPGCQADMMPILVGRQGVGKSRALRAMAPRLDLFCELSFHMKEDDMVRQMKGTLVGEVSELQGMGTRDLQSIKAFVTRVVESWIPKFKEKRALYLRRTILFGTTNETGILWDDENRRFLPVTVGTLHNCDITAIKRDCEQLWAEAAHRARLHGRGGAPCAEWEEAQKLAPKAHERYIARNESWEERLDQWIADALDNSDGSEPCWTFDSILQDAFGITAATRKKSHDKELRLMMDRRGYEYAQKREFGTNLRRWRRK